MKSAIVTGANGFIGSAIVHYLLSTGVKVCAIVHNDNKSRLIDCEREYDHLKIVSCDMSNIGKFADMEKSTYDVFYHTAWSGSAGPDRSNYEIQLNNVKWSMDAIIVAKKMGCSRIVFAGTIMEDEAIESIKLDEYYPGSGLIYGSSKAVAHMMSLSIATQYGIDLIWAKITNAYGPGEISPRLINTTIKKCISGNAPRFTSGIQNYDFVYIDDVAKAFYLIGKNGKPFHTYTIGSSSAKPLKNYLMVLRETIAPNIDFVFGDIPFEGINLPLESFDTTKTEKDTGFKALIKFEDGCIETKKWLQRHSNDSNI